MKSLIHEIHRRSLWQVLGIYLAGSWVALQVVEQLTEAAGLPDWVRPFSLVLLVLGFPIVMATAFVQEGMTTKHPAGSSPATDDAPAVEGSPTAAGTGSPTAPLPNRRNGLFTWRNALLGGAAAFTLLGIVTAAYLFMRSAGIGPAGTLVAAGVLDERDPILIADMESGSGDPALARTATDALRADIVQSPTVTLISADRVSEALARMRRDADTPLDLPLARELATREGIKAVIAGEVNAAGDGYVFTARILSAETGEVLASRRESAADDGEVIDAIDRLSKGLRERLGESLRSVRASPPLARVTTGSLEALRKFQEGDRLLGQGDREGGLAVLYEAVEIDTAFATAWRRIATELGNAGNPPEARVREIEAATKGWLHRDRLTPFERVRAEAIYHRAVTGDRDRELAVYERGVVDFPESTALLNNLAVQLIDEHEEFERAEEVTRRALAATDLETSGSGFFLEINLTRSLLRQGKLDQADSVISAAGPRYPAAGPVLRGTAPAAIRLNRGQWEAAQMIVDSAGAPATSVLIRMLRGMLEAGRPAAEARLAALDRTESGAEYLALAVEIASADLRLTGDGERAADLLEEALERHPLAEMHPFARPYAELARLHASLGRTDDARRLLEEFETEVAAPLGVVFDPDLERARAELALAEGRIDEAIAAERRAVGHACRHRCPDLARIYDRGGRADSARALYTRFVEHPIGFDISMRSPRLGPALERVAQLYDEAGDLEQAARYYARFVDLWSEADEALQPRVRAAQARLEAILGEIG